MPRTEYQLMLVIWSPVHAGAERRASDEKQEGVVMKRLLQAPSFLLLLVSAMLGAAIFTILDPFVSSACP